MGIKKKLISLHDYNETNVIKKIASSLNNKRVVLISDAGSPLVSDPGFKLVKYCLENSVNVTAIPGASSLIPALQLSGIPMNEFYFSGFFPKNNAEALRFINKINNSNITTVFFVSNHRIEECLSYLSKIIKDRLISISKELTKMNEKTFRGFASEVKNEIIKKSDNLKGEFVIVIEGKIEKGTENIDLKDYIVELREMLNKFSLTDVVRIVHKLTGINKNKLYKWILNLKKS